MKIIGLTGKKRHGKDTVCQIVMQDYHPQLFVTRLAFADDLKDEVACVLDTPVSNIEKNKELFRPLLQWWGTEWRRGQDVNYWVRRMETDIDELARLILCDIAIVTDVRYPNEADMIRRKGGTIVRVVRKGFDSTDTHISEHAMDDYPVDYTIEAENLDELKAKTEEMMRWFLAEKKEEVA